MILPSSSRAVDPVRAEIGKETAWTGEAVPLIITLYSSGPFSGTASFDLPDLPRTAMIKTGNPLVGSEEIGDDSYFTQRHEFTLYTQQAGDVVLPPFQVRFAGKKTFTSDPEPMEGTTPELRFQSKRPPGTESMGVVVAAAEMEVQQTWNPEQTGEINAGDVVIRTIVRSAVGTTAMMLPDVSGAAPDGVQVYSGAPEVQDKTERGDASAQRTDTVKYQFQRAGSFALPDLTVTWWDPKREELRSETLTGLEIEVTDAAEPVSTSPASSSGKSSVWGYCIVGLFAFVLLAYFLRKPVGRWNAARRAYYNRPDVRARRELRAACISNHASGAYAALIAWFTTRRDGDEWQSTESFLDMEQNRALREQWEALSQHLFAPEPAPATWDGRLLWGAFSRSEIDRSIGPRRNLSSALPALNPAAVRGNWAGSVDHPGADQA